MTNSFHLFELLPYITSYKILFFLFSPPFYFNLNRIQLKKESLFDILCCISLLPFSCLHQLLFIKHPGIQFAAVPQFHKAYGDFVNCCYDTTCPAFSTLINHINIKLDINTQHSSGQKTTS